MKWNIKMALSLALASALTGTGCLKDKDYDDGLIQSTRTIGSEIKVVEIKLEASSTENFFPFFIDNSSNDTVVQLIPVNLATNSPAPTDLHVTLVQNDQLITDYNAVNTDTTVTAENPDPTYVVTHYDIPNGMYTVVNPVVTIPKGEHTGYLQIKLKPADFLGTKKWAVGFSISKVDESGYTISGNSKDGIVNIGIKNKYDGYYAMNIKTLGWAAYNISDGPAKKWPSDVTFETTGINTLVLHAEKETHDIILPVFSDKGAPTGFGNTEAEFSFDLVTDKITDVRNTVDDGARNRSFHLNPDEQSRYDAATKTVYASFIMTQSGRPPQFFYDTLVFDHPR